MTESYTWVEADRATLSRYRHGQGHLTDQFFSFKVQRPAAKTLIASISTGKGMGPSFDGTPVITSGNQNRINTIKNSFIMSSSSVRISLRKLTSQRNFLRNLSSLILLAAQVAKGHATACSHQRISRVVGQDSHETLSLTEFF
ncbi:Uncharacterised protein [Streptococcus pneumoniae]|nr:Uncharacterised protein [Streptococcus pneumoniae]